MITQRRENKIKEVQQKRWKNIIVVLEDIKDKYNTGAILRNCDAFGVKDVYFIFNNLEKYQPEELTATSVGSSKWLNYEIFDKGKYLNPTLACLEKIKQRNFSIVATVIDEKAESLFQFQWPAKTALCLGNETNGLSEEIIKNADFKVYIPMRGMVQSLNVSVAAGIFLYDFCLKQEKILKFNK